MYKIIGADGKQYGPVTIEQMRQWVAEGRINSQTMVQAEGSTEWKPLELFPDLAGSTGTAGLSPVVPPSAPPADANVIVAEILTRDYSVDIGRCISRGWALVKGNFWPVIGTTFLASLLIGLGNNVYTVCIGIFLAGPMLGGLYYYFLKQIRHQTATVGDSFAGFSLAYMQLFLAYIVTSLLGLVGLILCILPGIYFIVSWCFTFPLVIDKKLQFWDAMEVSRKVVTKHWWTVFGLMLVVGLLAIAGVLACCVGVFVTTPIAYAAMMYAYEDIFGEATGGAATLPEPTPVVRPIG